MLRKGKLHRICIKCEKTFEPSGKSVKICNKCKGDSWMDYLYRKQRRFQ